MFQNQKEEENNPHDPNLNAVPNNSSKESDFKIEDFPVHTMREDLDNLKNPKPSQRTPEPALSDEAKEKGNPFLNQEKWTDSGSGSSENIPNKGPKIEKIVLPAVIVFIILALGMGGYYFWKTRMNSEEQKMENLSDNIPPLKNTTEVENNIPDQATGIPGDGLNPNVNSALENFSEENFNYLSIDIEKATSVEIKQALRDAASKVLEMKSPSAIEFVVTDKLNNPVSFQNFSQKIGIKLSENVLSGFEPSFNLYIYADENLPRMGLSVFSKNGEETKSILLEQEKSFSLIWEPLYLASSYSLASLSFSESSYKNRTVRYSNIPSTENLSLDYTIDNSQLILGTSKMTLRAILDKIDQKKATE